MYSVLIIDDNLLIRNGLKQVVRHEYRDVFFGEIRHLPEAFAELEKRPWDLIILDTSIDNNDGLRTLAKIRQRYPDKPILALSTRTDFTHAVRVRKLGATGYAGKDASRADLVRAISDVLAGKSHFNGSTGSEYSLPDCNSLSPREHYVMVALASGKRAIDIAADLNVSIKTVSTYKRRLFNKLQLNSLADLVRFFLNGSQTS